MADSAPPQPKNGLSPVGGTPVTNSMDNGLKTEDGKEAEALKSESGGRLSFFLDGKLVLELTSLTDGSSRSPWMPVTKKTYWPPPCASGSSARHESSTSYSVSDESSLQSSPWQRETRWKQPVPHRNANTALSFCFVASRPRQKFCYCRIRRRPLVTCVCSASKNCRDSRVRHRLDSMLSKLTERAKSRKFDSPSSRKREKTRYSSDPLTKKAKAILAPPQVVAVQPPYQPTKVYDKQSSYSIDSLLGKERPETSPSPSFLLSLLSKTNGIHGPRLPVSHPGFLAGGSHVPPQPLWAPFPLSTHFPHVSVPAGLLIHSRQQALLAPGPRDLTPPTPDTEGEDEEEGPLNLSTNRATD